MTKDNIIDYLKKNKDEFYRKYNIERFALFGSYAKNLNKSSSDIDLLYRLKENSKMSYDKYLELEEKLEKAFNSKVDLINEKRVNPIVLIDAKKDLIYV